MFVTTAYTNDREGNDNPLQYSFLENPMNGGAWWAAVHGVAKSRIRLSDFTFTFHFHALKKEMATHSSVLARRIPGMGEPGGLPSMGLHRVGHDWSDIAAAAAYILIGSSYIFLYKNILKYTNNTNIQSRYIKLAASGTLHTWYEKSEVLLTKWDVFKDGHGNLSVRNLRQVIIVKSSTGKWL